MIGIKRTYQVTLHRHIGSCEWVEFELGLHVWVEYGALYSVQMNDAVESVILQIEVVQKMGLAHWIGFGKNKKKIKKGKENLGRSAFLYCKNLQ